MHHMTLNHTRRTQQQLQSHTHVDSYYSSLSSPAGLAGSGLRLNSSNSSSNIMPCGSHISTSAAAAAAGKTVDWLSSSQAAAAAASGAGSSQLLHRNAGKAAPGPGQLLSRRTVMDSIVEVRQQCALW